MSSTTFTLRGVGHVLSSDYFPPIELDSSETYALGLIGLYTYHSIPNVIEGANKFYYDDKVITIPVGSYEINNIEDYINEKLKNEKNDGGNIEGAFSVISVPAAAALPEINNIVDYINDGDRNNGDAFSLKANNNTLQCEIKSKYCINFEHDDSIGRMLGFSPKILVENVKHESDLPVQIIKVETIRVECSITSSAYYNAQASHTLYEFSPQVEPGFAIVIEPQHVIYLPINKRDRIDNITLTLLDQQGRPVDFRGEQIVIRLELKKM